MTLLNFKIKPHKSVRLSGRDELYRMTGYYYFVTPAVVLHIWCYYSHFLTTDIDFTMQYL